MSKRLLIFTGAAAALIGFIANRINAARNFATDLEYSFAITKVQLRNFTLSFKLNIKVYNPTKLAIGVYIPIILRRVQVFFKESRIAQIPQMSQRIEVKPETHTTLPELNVEIPINITTLPVLAEMFKTIGSGIQLSMLSLNTESANKITALLTENSGKLAKLLTVRIDLNAAGIDFNYVVKPGDYLSGIGVTAKKGSRARATKPRDKYNHLIPPAKGETITIETSDNVLEKTVETMRSMVKKYAWQTEKVAPLLKRNTVRETALSLYNFIFEHLNYRQDRDDREELRVPSRLWSDGYGDCDCFANFIASVLYNLGIKYNFVLFRYHNEPTFHHVYVVAYDENNQPVAIDPVLEHFSEKLEGITKNF